MAQTIPFDVPTPDPRIVLQARLQQAPAEHAEALLAAYEVLQGLHDAGVFDLVRGALGSRDKVLEIAVGTAESPASIRTIRNLLLLVGMLGQVDPETLRPLTEAAPEALKVMLRQPEKPGLWTLIKDFLWNQDFRHGMAALNTMLEVLGRNFSRGHQTHKDDSAAATAVP